MNLYLSDHEQEVVHLAALELGTTQAYIVRLAFRSTFDLPIGPSGRDELAHLVEFLNRPLGRLSNFGHVQNLTDGR